MVKFRAARINSIVTRFAARSKRGDVSVGKGRVDLRVASRARGLVKRRGVSVGMTIFTRERRAVRFFLMRRQNKRHGVVVEVRGTPTVGNVTGFAFRSHAPRMTVVFGVTGYAVARRSFEYLIFMAARASGGCVFAVQVESGVVVIENAGLPRGGRVAGLASRSQLTLMRVNLRVTGRAVARRSLEELVGVTARASDRAMFAV